MTEPMPNALLRGVAGGVLGTTALNVATYLDMAVRGRPASSIPEQDVQVLADKVGLDLSAGGSAEVAEHRKQGIGALMGYATGIGIGAVYGLARSRAPRVPVPIAAVALGLGAMAATDAATTLLGNTNPAEWTVTDWAMDLVPHLVYGYVTAVGYETFGG